VIRYSVAMLLTATMLLTACGSSSDSDPTDPGADSSAGTTDAADNLQTPTETGDSTGDDNGENAGGGDATNPPETDATDGSTQMARYRLTFNASWSAATHPDQFPSNPHFSGLIGAVHNAQVIFWEPGQPATPGIEQVAETGGKGSFRPEIESAMQSGYANAMIDAGGVGTSPGSVSVEFDVSADFSEVTVVTMLAPSPDWFVGVHGLNLMDEDGFVAMRTVDLPLYDAGTDSGLNYVASNSATDPLEPISRLSSQPEDAPFLDGLPIVGQFVFERL